MGMGHSKFGEIALDSEVSYRWSRISEGGFRDQLHHRYQAITDPRPPAVSGQHARPLLGIPGNRVGCRVDVAQQEYVPKLLTHALNK